MSGKGLDILLVLLLVALVGGGIWHRHAQRAAAARAAADARQEAVAPEEAEVPAPPASPPAAAPASNAFAGIPYPTGTAVPSPSESTPAPAATAENAPAPAAPLAPVEMIEYGDYLCPHCQKTAPAVRAFTARHPTDVVFRYRHFPLFGLRSYIVAMAAECAGKQGRSAEAHEALYGGVLEQNDFLEALVRTARIPDAAAFRNCVLHMETRSRIDEDKRAGEVAGIHGTPAFIVNGRAAGTGEQTVEDLEYMLKQARRGP